METQNTPFVGIIEYNRISGMREEDWGNSGFGRCIYKSMKPESLRFACAENQSSCDALVMSQAPPGSCIMERVLFPSLLGCCSQSRWVEKRQSIV